MNGMNFKPFITKVLDSLSDEDVGDLYELINKHSDNFTNRSLVDSNNLLTASDKGVGLFTIQLDFETIRSGYLLYNNSYCVLLAYVSNSERVVEFVIANNSYKPVKEYLTTDFLRHEVAIRAIEVGQQGSITVQADDIDSENATAGKVLASDGEGGAEWENVMDVITPETVESGSAVQLFGFDSEGNLVKDDVPEGILVDSELNTESDNAVANAPVATAISDINEELEDKANVDGNYPTMTVGLADNLTPYDEESGDDQDEPFSFQATGTANGTQSDFATGSNALLREKQGNTVCVNQWLQVKSTASENGITFTSNQDGTYTLSGIATATAGFNFIDGSGLVGFKAGRKMLLTFTEGVKQGVILQGYDPVNGGFANSNTTPVFTMPNVTTTSGFIRIRVESGTDLSTPVTFTPQFIDLTQWFNGDIPQDLLAHPENFFRYYNGDLSYNTGTLVNANSQYIKCIGRQQWDEQWELGGIDSSTGNNSSSSQTIRSKNYIKVIPNAEYQYAAPYYCNIRYYDANKNYLGYTVWAKNSHNVVPSNVCYIRFILPTDYGTTYNNDITISIYYSGESGYDQYYPYEVLTNTDTGTETLRSAGSVKDYKTPDGLVHRVVGTVDLGSLTWDKSGSTFFAYSQTQIKAPNDNSTKVNAICSKYIVETYQLVSNNNLGIAVNTSNAIVITDSAYSSTSASDFKTAMSGVYLYYELATPTTEQGTTFSPNLVIDDFGSMEFSGTSGVPQGNLIFYPVDYKAFIDTLYNYTEGTPSNLVLQSDLSASETARDKVDNQLFANVGGMLRHQLADKENIDFNNTAWGDLGDGTWVYDSNGFMISAMLLGLAKAVDANTDVANIICPLFKTISAYDVYQGNYGIGFTTDSRIRIKYSGMSTDTTTFKAAMKGILIAYEKA